MLKQRGLIVSDEDTALKQLASISYFLLAFTYRFGKLKASVKKTETTIENSDEVGGISRGK